jgi:hypothetical protein
MVLSSCRKCYECSIVCHDCYRADSLVISLCSDSLADLRSYNKRIDELDSTGLDCRSLNKNAEKYCIHESEDSRYALYYANRQCVEQ